MSSSTDQRLRSQLNVLESIDNVQSEEHRHVDQKLQEHRKALVKELPRSSKPQA